MEAPAITRSRRPFLLPVWLTFAAGAAIFAAIILAYFLTYRAATTTIVVVARHAEQQTGSIQDPPLSPEGEQRAQRLAQMFGQGSGAGQLDAIYVTDSRRAQQTAAPLAERLGKQPIVLSATDVKTIVARVRHEHSGGVVMIISHGKTIPPLVHDLSGIEVPAIGAEEYDTIYVVSIPSFGHARLLRMQY